MKLQDSVVFITGANRGLGLEFAGRPSPAVRARCTRRRAIHRR